VPSAISKTDLIACIPYHLAKHYDLAMYEIPFELPAIEYFLYWHLSADHDAAHAWMREQIMEVAKAYNH
jgi:DNA-binding transcriptional LysR family regulator